MHLGLTSRAELIGPTRKSGRVARGSSALRQQWPHEGSLVTQHAAALVTDPVGGDEVRVDAEPAAVHLVRGEAREAEQGQCAVAGALGGQEVAVVHTAVQ